MRARITISLDAPSLELLDSIRVATGKNRSEAVRDLIAAYTLLYLTSRDEHADWDILDDLSHATVLEAMLEANEAQEALNNAKRSC